jgi:hypothetical protein
MLRQSIHFSFCRNEIEDGYAILNRRAEPFLSESRASQAFLSNDTIDSL